MEYVSRDDIELEGAVSFILDGIRLIPVQSLDKPFVRTGAVVCLHCNFWGG